MSENHDDEIFDELNSLNQIIDEYDLSAQFDKNLFDQIVKEITVVDNSTVRFKLLGDIELIETINEKARCKSREDKSDTVRL